MGARTGQYSIRINDQWRICFESMEGGGQNVEIVDGGFNLEVQQNIVVASPH